MSALEFIKIHLHQIKIYKIVHKNISAQLFSSTFEQVTKKSYEEDRGGGRQYGYAFYT
jgi:hypothetical protein